MASPKKTTKKTNRRRPVSRKRSGAPLWAWIVISLLVAALVVALIFLLNRNDGVVSSDDAPSTAIIEQEPVTPQPRFDFYEILKEREIVVPDRSEEVVAAVQSTDELYLQVASFRSAQDADELRANLLLQNMNATVEQVDNSGSLWHRVLVGPFESRSRMARARSDLAAQEFNTLLIRRQAD